MRISPCFLAVAATALLASAAAGHATGIDSDAGPQAPVQSTGTDTQTPFLNGARSDPERLAMLRGTADLVSNDQTLRGTVGANLANEVVTGANTITAGAFASASGIPIVIQNSGANVLIQNATIINLKMQ